MARDGGVHVSDGDVERGPDDDPLRRVGTRAWMVIGILLLSAIVYAALATVSGLVAPLVVAVVIGMLFATVVDRLATVVPRQLAAGGVLVGLLLATVLVTAVAVEGIVDQSRQIGAQLQAGWVNLEAWLTDVGFDWFEGSGLQEGLGEFVSGLVGGVAGYAGTVFSSAAALVAGMLVAVFLLYFVLADWHRLSGWVGTHLGVPADVGRGIVDDATFLTRQYFIALTISSLVTAVVIGVAAVLLGVPLAFTIAAVTFATSYVPYIGAIFSGAFAALIALGSGGPTDALVLLVVILVAQNIIQTIVQTQMTEDRLSLHPIVAFGSTIVGATLAGILGATLSAPVVALVIRIVERLGAATDGEGDRA